MRRKPVDQPVLTPREREVAEQVMLGASNKEIAKTLHIKYETVKEHVQNILLKYGVNRREHIAIRLLRETLSAESLGIEFTKEFDRRALELERLAEEVVKQTAAMRVMVASAVRRQKSRRV